MLLCNTAGSKLLVYVHSQSQSRLPWFIQSLHNRMAELPDCLYVQNLINSETPKLSSSCTHTRTHTQNPTTTKTCICVCKRTHKRLLTHTWQLWPSQWQQPNTCSIQCLITWSLKGESGRLHQSAVCVCTCVCVCTFSDMQIYNAFLPYTPHSLSFKVGW